jgi:endonuclease/exonuclease/phosphatase family metal-dependent hydrolase
MATLRVMTWNVENFAAPGGGGIEPPPPEVFDAKLRFLGETIRQIDPDLVALQEIGNEEAFHALQAELGMAYAHAFLSTKPGTRPIRVGIISKRALTDVVEIRDYVPGRYPPVPALAPPGAPPADPVGQMSRGAVAAVVTVGATRVRVLTAHLKSKLLSYPRGGGRSSFTPVDENERTFATFCATAQRNTEAATLRDFGVSMLGAEPATRLVVLGDLNDVPAAASTQIFLGPEDRDASRPDADDPIRLFNLAEPIPGPGGIKEDIHLLPNDRYFSRRFNGRGELIDHILASRNLLGAFQNGALTGVAGFDIVVETITEQDAGIGPTARLAKARPDHAPAVATFRLDGA